MKISQNEKEQISGRIRKAREYFGLSREKLARLVDCSTINIYQIEQKDSMPTAALLTRLIDTLKLDFLNCPIKRI